jgi:hypothetical protein
MSSRTEMINFASILETKCVNLFKDFILCHTNYPSMNGAQNRLTPYLFLQLIYKRGDTHSILLCKIGDPSNFRTYHEDISYGLRFEVF